MFSRNALIQGRNNGKSFNGCSLHSTQEDSNNTENTKDQSPQLKQQAEDKQDQMVIKEKNCVEDDDGGLFFIEASRQAARTRQLQLLNASSSSSSILSITNTNNQVGDDEDDNGNANITIAPVGITEEEEDKEQYDVEGGVGVEIHKLVSNENDDKVTQARTNDEETKTMEDSESHTLSGNGMIMEVTAKTIENKEVIVANDDDRLDLPPSSRTTDNAASSGITDDFMIPSETAQHQVSSDDDYTIGETLIMPEFENPLVVEGNDNTSEKVRLSSDGKVIFEPKTNLEGNVNKENVDMGLMVLTRALIVVKSILDRKE